MSLAVLYLEDPTLVCVAKEGVPPANRAVIVVKPPDNEPPDRIIKERIDRSPAAVIRQLHNDGELHVSNRLHPTAVRAIAMLRKVPPAQVHPQTPWDEIQKLLS